MNPIASLGWVMMNTSCRGLLFSSHQLWCPVLIWYSEDRKQWYPAAWCYSGTAIGLQDLQSVWFSGLCNMAHTCNPCLSWYHDSSWHRLSNFAPQLRYGGRSVPSERQNYGVSEMTVSTVQSVEGTVYRNYCVNPPSSAFLLWKVETRIRILVKTQTFCYSFSFPFPFIITPIVVCVNNTHATF